MSRLALNLEILPLLEQLGLVYRSIQQVWGVCVFVCVLFLLYVFVSVCLVPSNPNSVTFWMCRLVSPNHSFLLCKKDDKAWYVVIRYQGSLFTSPAVARRCYGAT